jgi:hypothetical protein
MKNTGQIWRSIATIKEGLIFGNDKKIYRYIKQDILNRNELPVGSMVEFIAEDGKATKIALLTSSTTEHSLARA